jgi:hypothetical protein
MTGLLTLPPSLTHPPQAQLHTGSNSGKRSREDSEQGSNETRQQEEEKEEEEVKGGRWILGWRMIKVVS